MVQARYLQLAAVILWGTVDVAGAQAQTVPAEAAPPPVAESGPGSLGQPAPAVPPEPAAPIPPAPPSGVIGSEVSGGASVGVGGSPYGGPASAPVGSAGFVPGGPPPILPAVTPMSPMMLQRYRTGRALYGVGTALGLVGSGLTLASIVVTAVYGFDKTTDPSKTIIGPSLAYAGSGATGAGFFFSATGLGLEHSALASIGQDPGRGLYGVGTLLGILGIGGIGASYFFSLTNYVDNSTTVAFGTSIAASVLLTVGGLLYFSDQTRLGVIYRRLTTF